MGSHEVLIVGAGLIGSALAIYLGRMGYRVQVFEKQLDPRDVEPPSGRSINITLCERGLRALERIDLAEAAIAASVPVFGRMVHLESGDTIFQPYGSRNEALFSISRRELGKLLVSRAGQELNVTLTFGQVLEDVEIPTTTAVFQTADARAPIRLSARIIVGADGAFSRVRRAMQRLDRFDYSQSYVDQGYRELHVPAGAGLPWLSERHALHIWPRGRRMFIGFPNTDGSFTLALHLPFKGASSFESIQTRGDFFRFLSELFPDLSAYAAELWEDYTRHTTVSMVTIRCAPWTQGGRLALIGDAAHAIVPSYGQGANAGFEDCEVLADALEQHQGQWSAALAAYEAARKPNADVIADLAIRHFHELQTAVGDPEFHVRKEIERYLSGRYPDRYKDLYSMISFTRLPYTEALRLDLEQQALVQELMSQRKMRGEEVETPLEPLAGRFIGGRPPVPAFAEAFILAGSSLR